MRSEDNIITLSSANVVALRNVQKEDNDYFSGAVVFKRAGHEHPARRLLEPAVEPARPLAA